MADAPVAAPVAAPAQPSAEAATPTQKFVQEYEQSGQPAQPKQEAPNPYAKVNALLKELGIKNKIGKKEVPVEDIEVLLKSQQSTRGWQMKAEELSRMQEEVQAHKALIEKAKTSKDINERIRASRELLGDSFDEIAENELWNKYQKEKQLAEIPENERRYMSEMEKMQAKLQQYEAEKAAQQKQVEEYKQRQLEEHYRTQIDKISVDALSKILDQESAPRVAPMLLPTMAKAMQRQLELGIDVDPSDLANIAYESWNGTATEFVKKLSPEGIYKFLGPELVKALNRYQVSLHSQPKARPPQQQSEPKPVVKQGENVWQQLKKQGLLK